MKIIADVRKSYFGKGVIRPFPASSEPVRLTPTIISTVTRTSTAFNSVSLTGDLLLLIECRAFTSSTNTPTGYTPPTATAGWFYNDASAANNTSLRIAYKFAEADNEQIPATSNGTSYASFALTIRDVDPTTPIIQTPVIQGSYLQDPVIIPAGSYPSEVLQLLGIVHRPASNAVDLPAGPTKLAEILAGGTRTAVVASYGMGTGHDTVSYDMPDANRTAVTYSLGVQGAFP